MNKEELTNMVAQSMSIGDISKDTGLSKSTVRYWLKVYDLKTLLPNMKNGERYDFSEIKICPKCQTEKNRDEFYNKRNNKDCSSYCKECTKQDVLERQRKLKKNCVDYKGGRCVECGYNKCLGALDFHHINPEEKEFSIGKFKLNSFDDKMKIELDKCVLLCSNCHREKHYKF